MTDEEIMTGVAEEVPAPVPEPEPLPEPAPEPAPAPEPEEPAVPVEVVTVDDLLDRLTGAGQEETEEPSQEEETENPEELPEEPVPAEPVETVGMDAVLKSLETLQGVTDHPMMETSFDDYTVTEGLLLLIFVILLLDFFLNLLRRWF